tara:strand:+ start:769 stop:1347 length:579 start_codon:yes stop_codon:yes gene_type:complete
MANYGKASILDSDQHQAFLQFLENQRHTRRNQAIYLLSYRAGLRVQSIAGLLLNDVLDSSGNLKEVVELRPDIVKKRKNYAIYLTHPELRNALLAYLSERPNMAKVDNVFVSQRGNAFTPNSLTHTLLTLYRKAGLDGASSHSGRRSYATNLIRSGLDIVAVQRLMNHATTTQTAEYVETNDEFLKNAVMSV